MILLGRIEVLVELDLGDDWSIVHMRLVELGDISLGDARLLGIGRENCRAILSPGIRSLAVELGRIVGDREINLQDTAVADLARIEGDPDRFRVSGCVGADHFVMRRSAAPPA